MQPEIRVMSSSDWAMLIVLSILWGGSFFFVGIAVKALPPLTIATLRVSLAALTLFLFLSCSGQCFPRDIKLWCTFVVMGILNNVIPFSLIIWGQSHISSGLASILNATTPLFAVLVAHLCTDDEKMNGKKIFGVSIGFAGVAVMIGWDTLTELGSSIYSFAILGAALSYSFAGIYGRRFRRLGIKPIITATGQVSVSSLILIPAALFIEKPCTLPAPDLEVWLAIAGLAILSTSVAYILYFRILATAGATNVLLVTLLIPVSAILLGTLFLGEEIELPHFVGMGLIGAGLLSIDGRLFSISGKIKARMEGKHEETH